MTTPFTTAHVLRPGDVTTTLDKFYQHARGKVLGSSGPFKFLDSTLRGQLGHSSIVVGHEGIPALGVEAGSLIIADAWRDQSTAERAFDTHIQPALQGGPQPVPLHDIELVGCICNPKLSEFNARTAVTSLMTWSLDIDPRQIYRAVFEQILGGSKPMLDGSGIHFAFQNTLGELTILEIWQNGSLLQAALDNKIMPAVTDALSRHDLKPDPTILPARPIGIAVSEPVRYCAN